MILLVDDNNFGSFDIRIDIKAIMITISSERYLVDSVRTSNLERLNPVQGGLCTDEMAAHEDTQKHKIDDNIMTETFSESISEDYKRLYETKERYDTIITVGKEPNIERIYAHSLILCTRSSYFHRALSDEWAEKKEGYFTLSKPNISTSTFKTILKFLYCGIVELRTQEDEIIELLVAVDELLIQKLNDIIQKFLIKNSLFGDYLQSA
ncbi:32461_t:CDS:2 [Gigaspora margarita]|uniref:32461_t:CDS:1 n=1 Tax=Gigaspora margarita TaxID=4874 RepID=A0ABN7UGW0_GIGMA|nr:32461_t:CDS:2 [Gigaspora margarita]